MIKVCFVEKPVILCAPEPRSLELIFTVENLKVLQAGYQLIEVEQDDIANLSPDILAQVSYIIGQPSLSRATLAALVNLRCIFNVESNLLNNMPYDVLFERGIHVVTTGAVFAKPVAELGLGLALCLARNIVDADLDFRQGSEAWGGEGNQSARLLSGASIGLVGFGDLGKELVGVLGGFRAKIQVFDPWLPPSAITKYGATPASLEDVFSQSDVVFVVASVTSDNLHFIDKTWFARMQKRAHFILLSRADVVNFDDLIAAVKAGHIQAASDVFPQEPLALDHPVRGLKGFIRSAHRAGALDVAFTQMGEMVLEDLALLDKNLPPMSCKRAERETVARMRSKPVTVN